MLRHYRTQLALRKLHGSIQPAAKIQLNQLDQKWSQRWKESSPTNSLHPTKHIVNPDAPSFYSLLMFPYPLGMLHMGHLRVYTISDVIARFKRLKGYNVIHPMGWDAFGLPAENAAFERGINPDKWTLLNIEKMKEQMQLMLADFDWDREVTTSTPEYYKWTQKIFLLLHEHDLAYRKEAEINWDPVDKTVLANEQVDSDGRSWRSGAKVEKRNLEQWFIGITKYAKELNQDMSVLDQWPDKVKAMQRNWIGESHGAEVVFPIEGDGVIKVFTSRPETLFSVQFLAVSLDHHLVKENLTPELSAFIAANRDAEPDSKDGFLLDVKASIPIDPQNNSLRKFEVPIYVAPFVLSTYGHGAVMGCPAHDERDFKFWSLHYPDTPIIPVVGKAQSPNGLSLEEAFTERGVLYDSTYLSGGIKDLGDYNMKTSAEASSMVTTTLESHNSGGSSTQYRLRDWLISRQRYWGAPIPIIHCDLCGTVPVPDSQLPVVLPKIETDKFKKGNPLANLDSFVNTTCPSCGSPAKRDTDTMDTFMDSSWYFFRYLDSKNTKEPFGYSKATANIPVDMYIGGVEHAILHLLYLRFISKFLGDIGMWDGKDFKNEPFKQLVTQGMVHGKTFSDPSSGRCLKPEELDLTNPDQPTIVGSNATPTITFEKMSKSKYNGADPAECIKKYGADATRAHMIFQAPLSDILNWNEEQIHGVERWLHKVLNLSSLIRARENVTKQENDNKVGELLLNGKEINASFNDAELKLYNDVSRYINKIADSIEVELSFNTIISDLMKLTHTVTAACKSPDYISQELLLDSYKKLLLAMSPITPCVAEEGWESLGNTKSIFFERYPSTKVLQSQFIDYKIMINGKYRGTLRENRKLIDEQEDIVIEQVKKLDGISKFLTGAIKKTIFKHGMIGIITDGK